MRKLFFLLLIFIFQHSFSQTVLLEQNVNNDTIPPSSGPNMKNYTHSYFRYGFIVGDSEGSGADIIPGLSGDFAFGVRYKRRISNFYSLGFDVNYNNVNYYIKQNDSKIFPDTIIHNKKEKLAYNNADIELYNRFNFGKRGNILGTFLDLGGYGEWGFGIKHFYKDKLNDFEKNIEGAKTREVTHKNLLYTNALNYGAVARFGINRYVIYGKYRVSNLFKSSYNYPELPRIIVGIEIGLLK